MKLGRQVLRPMRVSMKALKRKRDSAAAAAPAKAKPAPVIALASVCSVKDAGALKISLCKAAGETAPVTLDIRGVERIDTATMQLLCAFVRDRTARALSVVWLGESQALQEAVRLLGVRELLPPECNDARVHSPNDPSTSSVEAAA